jgi:hypothetical protein
LRTLLDWHEHDGYVTSETEADWSELAEALATDDAMVDWSSDDTFVRRTWYPADFAFVLRWCVTTDPDDFGLPGEGFAAVFDLTGSSQLIETVRVVVPGADAQPAGSFFDARWRG